MPPKPNLSDWLTSQEAARRLSVKYRTLLDIVSKGRLHPRKIVREGVSGGAVSMFDPAEVESLLEQRTIAKTEIVPVKEQGIPAVMQTSLQTAQIPVHGSSLALALQGHEQFLTIEDAVLYIGLPYAELDRLVKSGELPARKAGRWYIRRRDLDRL